MWSVSCITNISVNVLCFIGFFCALKMVIGFWYNVGAQYFIGLGIPSRGLDLYDVRRGGGGWGQAAVEDE